MWTRGGDRWGQGGWLGWRALQKVENGGVCGGRQLFIRGGLAECRCRCWLKAIVSMRGDDACMVQASRLTGDASLVLRLAGCSPQTQQHAWETGGWDGADRCVERRGWKR